MSQEQEKISKEKEEISRQQYWYTTAVLTFMALVGNLTKPISNFLEFCIAIVMLLGTMILGIYMVIVCHKEYCARDGITMKWWKAFVHSIKERKGAFFCTALILIGGVGLIVYLASKAGLLGCGYSH
jgi:hypothetical protein